MQHVKLCFILTAQMGNGKHICLAWEAIHGSVHTLGHAIIKDAWSPYARHVTAKPTCIVSHHKPNPKTPFKAYTSPEYD